jgi:ATP-dependent helicase/nuclease subunit B
MAICPRIVALGDIDEMSAFSEDSSPAVSSVGRSADSLQLERRLVLARLGAAWAKQPVLSPLVVSGPAPR